MLIPPQLEIDNDILKLISAIDANRIYLSSLQVKPEIVEKVQRISYLKSSLFSARIEGAKQSLTQLDEKDREQIEIFNILSAIQFIRSKIQSNTKITPTLIQKIHTLVMKNVYAHAGSFRTEQSAIFNQAGIAVYVTPSPTQIKKLIEELTNYSNSKIESFPLIIAFLSHLIFEKIHPFLDGNGRVGRLLIYAILQSKGYNFGLHVAFEEYLDNHKDQYYHHLDTGLKNINKYVLFMLQAFLEQTEKMKETINHELQKKQILILPPRQEEIFLIIKDHPMISFDSLKRRFLKVPERTLRYDLKKLTDLELVIKVGITRGALYLVKEESE